jgi:branched-chain amino acid transport system permease protein
MSLFYGYLATAWNIVGGIAGQHSLGHAIFVGAGAYASTLLFIHFGITPWLGALVGAVLAGALALVMGFLSFRYGLRGPYFLLVTIAFAEVAKIAVANLPIAGASSGLYVPLRGDAPLLFQFQEKFPYLLVVALMCAGSVLLTRTIRRNGFGHALLALRDNEAAARACGVPAERYKLLAFMLSAALCAMGGTFYAQYVLFIEPTSMFGLGQSLEMVLFCIVGGVGTIYGPLAGALVLFAIAELTRNLTGFTQIGNLHLIVYSATLLVVVLFFPDGLAGALARWRARRHAGRTPVTAAPPRPAAVVAKPRPETKDVGLPLLQAEQITQRFGGLTALSGVSLSAARGECVGLIGPNGSGKSTLLNIIGGVYVPSEGRVLLGGEVVSGRHPEEICRLGIARTHQIAQPFGDLTSRENVMVGAFARTTSRAEAMAAADELLARLGIAHAAERPVRLLTAADRKKIEIARALATKPDVLLLDEALAGLTEQETEQMIAFLLGLRAEGLTLIVVEHVMRVVTALCDRVIVLNFGKMLTAGTPTEVLGHPDVIRAYLGSDQDATAPAR